MYYLISPFVCASLSLLRLRACELCSASVGAVRASLRVRPLLLPSSSAFRLFRLEKRKKRKREDRRSSRNRRKKKERGRERRRRARRKEKRGSKNGKRPPRSPEQGEVTHTDLQTGTSARGPQCRQGRLSCEREAVTRKASGRCVWRGRRECLVGGRVTSSRPGGGRPRPPQPRGGRGTCLVRGFPLLVFARLDLVSPRRPGGGPFLPRPRPPPLPPSPLGAFVGVSCFHTGGGIGAPMARTPAERKARIGGPTWRQSKGSSLTVSKRSKYGHSRALCNVLMSLVIHVDISGEVAKRHMAEARQ